MANSATKIGMRRYPQQARSQERVNQILGAAEQMFISEGYNAVTTNAIAARAKVPIGSLYQFFPDKGAIVQALAIRYTTQLYQRFAAINCPDTTSLPLSTYVDQIIDTTDQFFTDYPGYYAIFMEVQGTMPELEELDQAVDMQLIYDLSIAFSQRNLALTQEDCEVIGFVAIKVIGNLLWLSIGQEKKIRQRLVLETKRLALRYLQSYFPINESTSKKPSTL
jgi:AcrR family transcriptional regulator